MMAETGPGSLGTAGANLDIPDFDALRRQKLAAAMILATSSSPRHRTNVVLALPAFCKLHPAHPPRLMTISFGGGLFIVRYLLGY